MKIYRNQHQLKLVSVFITYGLIFAKLHIVFNTSTAEMGIKHV